MKRMTNCQVHGRQQIALTCVHVARAIDSDEQVGFFWGDDTDLGRPDAWCSECERRLRVLDGADSEAWFVAAEFKILCVSCWDAAKAKLYVPGR